MREHGPDLQYLPNLHWLQQKKAENKTTWRWRKKKLKREEKKKKKDILAAVSVCKS